MKQDDTFKFRLPQLLRERLQRESQGTGFSLAEIIRRAIDEYLVRKEKTQKEETL